MNIQSNFGAASYQGLGPVNSPNSSAYMRTLAGDSAGRSGSTNVGQESVTISDAAKRLASSSQEMESRLVEIKSKPATQRSLDEIDYLFKNDQKLASITAKDLRKRTAEEIDYMQKAGGLVNTFANLSPNE